MLITLVKVSAFVFEKKYLSHCIFQNLFSELEAKLENNNEERRVLLERSGYYFNS